VVVPTTEAGTPRTTTPVAGWIADRHMRSRYAPLRLTVTNTVTQVESGRPSWSCRPPRQGRLGLQRRGHVRSLIDTCVPDMHLPLVIDPNVSGPGRRSGHPPGQFLIDPVQHSFRPQTGIVAIVNTPDGSLTIAILHGNNASRGHGQELPSQRFIG